MTKLLRAIVVGVHVCESSLSSERILDPHVHSFADWSTINYTYEPGSIFYHNWTYEDYSKATHPSALPPTDFMFMSLVGVPKEQHLLQVQMAHQESQRIDRLGLSPRMVGIVSDADLADETSTLGTFLDTVTSASDLVVGVRPVPVPWDAGDKLLNNLREVQRRGLVWDVLLGETEDLAKLYPVAKQLPNLTIVVNHMGFCCVPGGDVPDFESWSRKMTQLASLPNVRMKVSGAQAPAPGDAKTLMRPFVEHVIQEFGYDRSIYNGNWFVVNAQAGFYSYRAWAQALDEYLEGLNATDVQRSQLLYNAGASAYGLTEAKRKSFV